MPLQSGLGSSEAGRVATLALDRADRSWSSVSISGMQNGFLALKQNSSRWPSEEIQMASSVFDVDGGNQQVRFSPEMLQMLFAQRESRDDREAYLLVRDGKRWGDMHRLRPGAVIPVGRVAADGIMVRDDRCSRVHCEFYLQDQDWFLRDLGSRNGTRLNGERIQVSTRVKNMSAFHQSFVLLVLGLGEKRREGNSEATG